MRQHTHSGPILETTDADYRQEDTIEFREKNDCIKLAIDSFISQGANIQKLNEMVASVKKDTNTELEEILSTIRIRSLD